MAPAIAGRPGRPRLSPPTARVMTCQRRPSNRAPHPTHRARVRRGFLWAGLTVIFLAQGCAPAAPPPRPEHPSGPVTEDFLQRRHAHMLDTVVDRPKRLEAFLAAQARAETDLNRSSFDLVMAEQKRILALLRVAEERGDEDFNRVLRRQENLTESLLMQRGFASPRDRAVFSGLQRQQQRILADLRDRARRNPEDFEIFQDRNRQAQGTVAERRRREREHNLAIFERALAEQERILASLRFRSLRNDEFFFELLEEAEAHRALRERLRLERMARFLERFGQGSQSSSP